MNATASTTANPKGSETPSWVKREIARLAKAAAMGGSSAAMLFERQAAGLAKKYNAWESFARHSIFTGAVNQEAI